MGTVGEVGEDGGDGGDGRVQEGVEVRSFWCYGEVAGAVGGGEGCDGVGGGRVDSRYEAGAVRGREVFPRRRGSWWC